MHVRGRGYASVNQSVCFQYLLRGEGLVQPSSGSTQGGTHITIIGSGFLTFTLLRAPAIGTPLSSIPWLARGFVWPEQPSPSSLCPSYPRQQQLYAAPTAISTLHRLLLEINDDLLDPATRQALLIRLYDNLPMAVSVGMAPCVVTWANLTRIECTTTAGLEGSANITIRVFNETLKLPNAFSYDDTATPAAVSISPSYGPVFGGTDLTIQGRFLQSASSVTIGDAPCTLVSKNSTHICCTSTPHAPSILPIEVTTSTGLAVVAVEGSGGDLQPASSSSSSSSSLLFRYALEVNSVGPLQGSLLGGQVITIRGRGFHPRSTTVLIGGRPAMITSANDSIVQFLTPPPTHTHMVTFTDGGYDATNGTLIQYNYYYYYFFITRWGWNFTINLLLI